MKKNINNLNAALKHISNQVENDKDYKYNVRDESAVRSIGRKLNLIQKHHANLTRTLELNPINFILTLSNENIKELNEINDSLTTIEEKMRIFTNVANIANINSTSTININKNFEEYFKNNDLTVSERLLLVDFFNQLTKLK